MRPITIKHWGGGTRVVPAEDVVVAENGLRIRVHFAHGHWLEFMADTGLEAARKKADPLDDGKGKLSTWHIVRDDLVKLQRAAAERRAAFKKERKAALRSDRKPVEASEGK